MDEWDHIEKVLKKNNRSKKSNHFDTDLKEELDSRINNVLNKILDIDIKGDHIISKKNKQIIWEILLNKINLTSE